MTNRLVNLELRDLLDRPVHNCKVMIMGDDITAEWRAICPTICDFFEIEDYAVDIGEVGNDTFGREAIFDERGEPVGFVITTECSGYAH